MRPGKEGELALEAGAGLLLGKGIEQLGGGEKPGGGASQHGLVNEVLDQQGLADAIGSDEDDVGGCAEPF